MRPVSGLFNCIDDEQAGRSSRSPEHQHIDPKVARRVELGPGLGAARILGHEMRHPKASKQLGLGGKVERRSPGHEPARQRECPRRRVDHAQKDLTGAQPGPSGQGLASGRKEHDRTLGDPLDALPLVLEVDPSIPGTLHPGGSLQP